jgi:hypothetical protein
VNLTTKFANELARRLEAIEQRGADDAIHLPAEPELDGLIRLARGIRALPPPDPDRSWLDRSKRRLLARFDTLQRAATAETLTPLGGGRL